MRDETLLFSLSRARKKCCAGVVGVLGSQSQSMGMLGSQALEKLFLPWFFLSVPKWSFPEMAWGSLREGN